MPDPSDCPHDIRMRGFARRSTVPQALAWLDGQLVRLEEETAPLAEAAGRVLSREVASRSDVPSFARAMMDGFALRAADTLGASPYNRLRLTLIGQSMPGRPFASRVGKGQAVRIMTGAPLPEGADAVLPAELVEPQLAEILAQGEVSPGKHVGPIGEDIAYDHANPCSTLFWDLKSQVGSHLCVLDVRIVWPVEGRVDLFALLVQGDGTVVDHCYHFHPHRVRHLARRRIRF